VATALLLGAAIAPTDAVLASDVEVGPPGEGKEDVVRYSLTAEAGLNDGLAFPFVNLAIAVALAGTQPRAWLTGWLLIDVLYRLLAGVGIGWLFGRVLARFVFRIPMGNAVARAMEGSIALAATLIVYGLTELAQGYGFVAVFVAACTLRQSEREHEYHQALHDFAEDIGRLLTAALLLLLGGAIAGGLLANLTWRAAGVAALLVFAVRPITAAAGLFGCTATVGERAAIAFFGIRGIGSFYYLAYALNHAPFARAGELWSLVALTVVISIVVHGVATEPAMRWLDRRRSALARVPRVACPPVSL
jgi:NhaP-type Na+/H+ or K+/H+ antiporter